MWKQFSLNGNYKWIDNIQDLVNITNTTAQFTELLKCVLEMLTLPVKKRCETLFITKLKHFLYLNLKSEKKYA
jgi:hypothetical protein